VDNLYIKKSEGGVSRNEIKFSTRDDYLYLYTILLSLVVLDQARGKIRRAGKKKKQAGFIFVTSSAHVRMTT
jgi:hypothetical protein